VELGWCGVVGGVWWGLGCEASCESWGGAVLRLRLGLGLGFDVGVGVGVGVGVAVAVERVGVRLKVIGRCGLRWAGMVGLCQVSGWLGGRGGWGCVVR
jgi:hypothetical protein